MSDREKGIVAISSMVIGVSMIFGSSYLSSLTVEARNSVAALGGMVVVVGIVMAAAWALGGGG